jgi:hypothetical protein
MRQLHRIVLLTVTLGLSPLLAGCENFDLDKLDFLELNKKKPLPGDRKPLFPEGVPGVSQGIPPEYLQGNLQQQTGAALDVAQPPADQVTPPAVAGETNPKTAAAAPVQQTVEEPAEKPKPKPKPKRRVAKRTPPAQPVSQPQNVQQQQQPSPWPAQAPPQQTAQQAQSPWPSPAQNNVAPWPSAPPPGTFSK